MKHYIVLVAAIGLALGVFVSLSSGQFHILKFEFNLDDKSPSEARNIRASVKYHFKNACEAQDKMMKAEDDNDVDEYKRQLQIMREEDKKMLAKEQDYLELRSLLEAKIWSGELEIAEFRKINEKGMIGSTLDHLIGRAKY